MATRKTDAKSKKGEGDPIKEWEKRLQEISEGREKNEEHKKRLQEELRRLTANRKAHETHIKEQSAIEYQAQKGKSSGALVDSIFKMDKGKLPESVQLELNILALQGALSECHAETSRLKAEEDMISRKINEHILVKGILAHADMRKEFVRAYNKLRDLHNRLCEISVANRKIKQDWHTLLAKSDSRKEVLPESKFDFQFALAYAPDKLPRTLLSVLERLRSLGTYYGDDNPFVDAEPNTGKPSELMRDGFESDGLLIRNTQDAHLREVINRVIPDNF